MKKNICIHAHFYQPPRENPWLEEIEPQDSAFPYHDWNQKITVECYAPNAAARIVDSNNKIIDIVNNYSKISHNFGPTVLSWLEKNEKETYKAILDADQESQKIFCGHGSAIAQCYNHIIMPLANSRDKKTQILWGLKDFESRFKRKPQSMWLPETGVDNETLELMAENGIKWIILSPFQAREIKPIKEKKWKNVEGGKINSQIPYLYRLESGRTIVIFFYEGRISQDIAFSDLLKNGENFANKLINSFSPDLPNQEKLLNIAVDGETFGHHKKFGDMALATCLRKIQNDPTVNNTIYSCFLEKNPPANEVKIWENSAWSCAHGVGRWSRDCGCKIANTPGWNQKWREELRKAMDWLRDILAPFYENTMSAFVPDPWNIRNTYIDLILDRSEENVEEFFQKNKLEHLSKEKRTIILKLLEMQRHAMQMYTSCGWFFDDISGIETIQIIAYAARAIQLAKELKPDFFELEDNYIELLRNAKSNDPNFKDGSYIYHNFVQPQILNLSGIAVDYIISSLFEKKQDISIYSYTLDTKFHDIIELEEKKLSYGEMSISSKITFEIKDLYFIGLLYSEHHVIIGLTDKLQKDDFLKSIETIKKAFQSKNLLEIKNLIEKDFVFNNFSFWDLFKEDQRHILKKLLWSDITNIKATLHKVHNLHYSILKDMKDKQILIPQELVKSLDLILNAKLIDLLSPDNILNTSELKEVVERITDWSFTIDLKNISFLSTKKIEKLIDQLSHEYTDTNLLNTIVLFFQVLSPLNLPWNLWKAQNVYFQTTRSSPIKELLKKDHKWAELFNKISEYLHVKIEG